MMRGHGDSTSELPGRSRWNRNLHIPHFLRQWVPSSVVFSLRYLKARFLTRGTAWHFSRDVKVEQSPEDSSAGETISVIVAIHDAPKVTRRCLVSLEKYAKQAEVILVDDGSSLLESQTLIEDFSTRNGWKVIRHERSLGHSAACQAGASLASRPYLCLLNSDTVVTHLCWRPIKDAFESDKTIGIAGPSTSNSGNRQTLPLARELCLYWNDDQICAFANQLSLEWPQPFIVDLPWVSGFAFFIRLELWWELGGFDPKLPDYGNEIELGNRAAARGFRKVWVGNSYIHHLGGQSYYPKIGHEGVLASIRAAETYIGQEIIK